MGQVRRWFPYIMLIVLLGAVGWALSFGTLPKADFTFINGTEIQSVDPAIVTGQPEGRIINAIFEGLYRPMPDPEDPSKLRPAPAAAESCEISADGKTYTFTMRPTARWSNGQPVTADDFAWSWQRFLHPETGSEYAYQLHYVKGAKKYNIPELDKELSNLEEQGEFRVRVLLPEGKNLWGILTKIEKSPEPEFAKEVDEAEKEKKLAEWKQNWVYVVNVKPEKNGVVDWGATGEERRFSRDPQENKAEMCKEVVRVFRVEVELADRQNDDQLFPRGTMLSGILTEIDQPPEPKFPKDMEKEKKEKELADWKRKWVYVVDVKPEKDGHVEWDARGEERRFSQEPAKNDAEECKHVLYHFSQVGIRAPSKDTLIVELNDPTPYFLDLVAFYPLYPVNRACIEEHGVPSWTKPANIVSNGPFKMKFRRIRDRIRMEKDPEYWNADNVALETVDALAVESEATQLNMYMNGQVEWATTIPNAMIPELEKRDDFHNDTQLAIYFYRVNVTHPQLSDHRVRDALNLAMNKAVICEYVTQGGQKPARSFVPPGLPGYESSMAGEYSLERAKELLAAAGYPDGKGFKKIEILYNTSEGHRDIAEVIQQQWKKLGIDVQLKNVAWSVYLDFVNQKKYDIARAGWIGDYPDPNTFLDMFVTDGSNNQTGWSNLQYDGLIKAAKSESDPAKRMAMFHDAEAILMDNWDDVRDMKIHDELMKIRRKDPKAGGLPIIPIYSYVSINMVRSYVKGVPPYDKFDSGFFGNIQDIHPVHILRIDEEEKKRVLSEKGLR